MDTLHLTLLEIVGKLFLQGSYSPFLGSGSYTVSLTETQVCRRSMEAGMDDMSMDSPQTHDL